MFLLFLAVGRMHIGHGRAVEGGRGHEGADAEAQEGVERQEDANTGEMYVRKAAILLYYAIPISILPFFGFSYSVMIIINIGIGRGRGTPPTLPVLVAVN